MVLGVHDDGRVCTENNVVLASDVSKVPKTVPDSATAYAPWLERFEVI